MKRGNVLTQLLHDAHCDKPRSESGKKCDCRARHDRSAIDLSWPGHTGSDGSEDQDAFEAFAENENTDVEGCHGCASICLEWIGRAMASDALPDENRDDKQC